MVWCANFKSWRSTSVIAKATCISIERKQESFVGLSTCCVCQNDCEKTAVHVKLNENKGNSMCVT